MKRTVFFALAMGLALAANAQHQPASPSTSEPVQAHPQVARSDGAERLAERDVEARYDRHCLTQTGSRLIRRNDAGRKCALAAGRSYTADDLWRTGAGNTADALRALDPAFN